MLRSARKLLLWRFICLQDNDPQQESQNCTGLTLKVLQWHIPDLNLIHSIVAGHEYCCLFTASIPLDSTSSFLPRELERTASVLKCKTWKNKIMQTKFAWI